MPWDYDIDIIIASSRNPIKNKNGSVSSKQICPELFEIDFLKYGL